MRGPHGSGIAQLHTPSLTFCKLTLVCVSILDTDWAGQIEVARGPVINYGDGGGGGGGYRTGGGGANEVLPLQKGGRKKF